MGLGLGLGTRSPFQLQVCFHLLDKGGIRTELCAPGITLDNLGCPVSSEYVNALHGVHFHIYHLHREFTPEVFVEEVAFWTQYTCHLEN